MSEILELRHLRSLASIADTRTLEDAAQRVYLTQSALSHQIRALEAHYRLTLFERTPRGLRFTAAGQRLLALARALLPQVDDAQRDLVRLRSDTGGELRIALECHTCFEWLMPVMDEFRRRWPEVEVDLVAGFHSDPLALLAARRADVVIGAAPAKRKGLAVRPLFRYEVLLVVPNEHRLRAKRHVEARDLAGETLITYPVPEARIDLIREVLAPARMRLKRRTAELTIAVLQLVASRRGIAALPSWGVKSYVDHDYVATRRIGAGGLWSELHAAAPTALAQKAYFADFVGIVRSTCQSQLEGISLL
jgi:LysR family transcriptional regulator, regulator for metE and metH